MKTLKPTKHTSKCNVLEYFEINSTYKENHNLLLIEKINHDNNELFIISNVITEHDMCSKKN